MSLSHGVLDFLEARFRCPAKNDRRYPGPGVTAAAVYSGYYLEVPSPNIVGVPGYVGVLAGPGKVVEKIWARVQVRRRSCWQSRSPTSPGTGSSA
eukprot:445268-Rhodomonas_salina.1